MSKEDVHFVRGKGFFVDMGPRDEDWEIVPFPFSGELDPHEIAKYKRRFDLNKRSPSDDKPGRYNFRAAHYFVSLQGRTL